MADIPLHHIVYGTCKDFVTGETLTDTDDERIRQKIARFLVEEKGFAREDLLMRETIDTLFARQFVTSMIDITLQVGGRRFLVLRYGPGSLVTRERAAIAAARVLYDDYRVPLAIVTNGEDAELLDTETGEVLETGMGAIPTKSEAEKMLPSLHFSVFADEKKRERELRILNAFDIEVCCAGGPCALPGASEGRGKKNAD